MKNVNQNIVIGVVVAIVAIAIVWWVGTQNSGVVVEQETNLLPQGQNGGQFVDPGVAPQVEVPRNDISASGTLNTEFQGNSSIDPVTGEPLKIVPLDPPVQVNQ